MSSDGSDTADPPLPVVQVHGGEGDEPTFNRYEPWVHFKP
jgi:hypothetical protein